MIGNQLSASYLPSYSLFTFIFLIMYLIFVKITGFQSLFSWFYNKKIVIQVHVEKLKYRQFYIFIFILNINLNHFHITAI
jgi:hypothetical protein